MEVSCDWSLLSLSWCSLIVAEGGGVGGRPRPYFASYAQLIFFLAQLLHGSVPSHRIFFLLQMSQALLTLGSFRRFSSSASSLVVSRECLAGDTLGDKEAMVRVIC